MNENKIEIRNLSKAFGKKVVLDGIDLDVKRGESLVTAAQTRLMRKKLSELRANRLKPCIPKWECCFRAVLCLTV